MSLIKQKVYSIKYFTDIFTLVASYAFAAIYYELSNKNYLFEPIDFGFLLFLITIWYFTSKSNKLYDEVRSKRSFVIEFFKSYNCIFFQAIAAGLFLFTMNHHSYDRIFVMMYSSALFILIPIEKIVLKKFTTYLRKKGKNLRFVLIIGAGKNGMNFYKTLKLNPTFGYQVIGFLDEHNKQYLNEKYLGCINQLNEVIKSHPELHEIVIALPNNDYQKVSDIVKIANDNGIRVRLIPDYKYILSNRYTIDIFGGQPVITLRHEPLEAPHLRIIKRTFDITFTIALFITVFPIIFPIIALLIKLDSKGPVFFKQKRLGRNKVHFDCYKFRTMTENVNSMPHFTDAKDQRKTKIGKFLRKTSLDELPQFYNVLIGDMSLVGPRPHMTLDNEEYSKLISSYMVRQLVKPGITGWAQINGYRGETKELIDMKLRIEHDVYYLENWSLALDIKIMFLTIWNILKGEENAF